MTVWFGDPERPVGVTVADGELAQAVRALFRPLVIEGPSHSPGETGHIFLERTPAGLRLTQPASEHESRRFRVLARALAALEYRVVLLLQERWADRTFIHGAGIRLGNGAVLALGPSGAGKSSLTLAASVAGHAVLGDDCLMVDAQGRVKGIPRLLKVVGRQLRRAGLRKADSVLPHPREPEIWWDPVTTGGWALDWYPIRLVALARWEPGKGPSRVTPMARAEGVRGLLNNQLPAGLSPAESLDRLLGVAHVARFVDLRFHDANEGIRTLMAQVG